RRHPYQRASRTHRAHPGSPFVRDSLHLRRHRRRTVRRRRRMTNKRPLAGLLSKIVLGTALAASLSGCVAMAVGGAATAVLSANDRRTLGMQTEDKAINVKAELKLQQLTGENGHVNVTSYNRKVLLTGEVRDEAM